MAGRVAWRTVEAAGRRSRQSPRRDSSGQRSRWRSSHGDRTRRSFGSRSGLPDERGTAMGRLAVVQGAAAEDRRLHPNGGRCAVLARLRRASMTASLDTSAQDAQRAIALYRDAQDRLGEFFAWHALLYSLTFAGRLDDARHALGETKRLLDPSWPPRPRGL